MLHFLPEMSVMPVFKIGLWNAWIFMSFFLLQMLVIIIAGKRVWDRSHLPKETRRSNLERYSGIIANLVWLSALAYSLFLPLQLGTVWFFIGLSIFIIGLALLTTATFNFITTPADQLITKGAYKFSRHPMYLATFFICLGAGIATASWIFIFISTIMALCFHREALVEERYCLNRYGNVYREYLDRTPGWIGAPKEYYK